MLLLGDILGSAGINLDPDSIATLQAILDEQSKALDSSRYGDLKLAPANFGAFDKSGSLDFHHDRAHQVVAKTVRELMAACVTFGSGVADAAKGVTTADETTAADLTRKARRVQDVDTAAYSQARNEQTLTPEPPNGSGDGA